MKIVSKLFTLAFATFLAVSLFPISKVSAGKVVPPRIQANISPFNAGDTAYLIVTIPSQPLKRSRTTTYDILISYGKLGYYYWWAGGSGPQNSLYGNLYNMECNYPYGTRECREWWSGSIPSKGKRVKEVITIPLTTRNSWVGILTGDITVSGQINNKPFAQIEVPVTAK